MSAWHCPPQSAFQEFTVFPGFQELVRIAAPVGVPGAAASA
jgi:hypothetical protein